jgi:hypothetical protein
MAVISEDPGYLFILAPGTGSTATAQALCREAGGRWVPPEDVRDANGKMVVPRKHTTIAELRRFGLDGDLLSRLFKFSSVRNPFDFWASQWLRLRLRWSAALDDPNSFVHNRPGDAEAVRASTELSFPEWLDRQLGPRAARGVTQYLNPQHMQGLDFTMHFETLQEDFDRVLERLGIGGRIELPKVNVTEERDPDYRSYYDEGARRLVEQVFAPYLRDFGYSF